MVDYTNLLMGNNPSMTDLSNLLGISPTVLIVLFAIVFIWEMTWKGIGMWKASQKNQVAWFIAMLVLYTVGILPILYIYVFSKMNFNKAKRIDHKNKKGRRR